MNESSERARVVEIARTWLGTPYGHAMRVKGSATDCAFLLVETFHEAGLIPYLTSGSEDSDIPFYPIDWHLHRDEERYLKIIDRFAVKTETDSPLPADIALYQFGRTISHGAIVVDWPVVIHAWRESNRVEFAEGNQAELGAHFVGIWRLRRWTA